MGVQKTLSTPKAKIPSALSGGVGKKPYFGLSVPATKGKQ